MLSNKEMIYIISIIIGITGVIWILIGIYGFNTALIYTIGVMYMLIPIGIIIVPLVEEGYI